MKTNLELIRDGDTRVLRIATALVGGAMTESGALAHLLIKKGVITKAELHEAAEIVAPEVQKAISDSLRDILNILVDELLEEETK